MSLLTLAARGVLPTPVLRGCRLGNRSGSATKKEKIVFSLYLTRKPTYILICYNCVISFVNINRFFLTKINLSIVTPLNANCELQLKMPIVRNSITLQPTKINDMYRSTSIYIFLIKKSKINLLIKSSEIQSIKIFTSLCCENYTSIYCDVANILCARARNCPLKAI